MNIKDYLQHCCITKKTSIRQLLNDTELTPQNFSNKLTRDRIYTADLKIVGDKLNADVRIEFLDKESGEPLHQEAIIL